MAEIPRAVIPAINPVITSLDDVNGTLDYVYDMSVGAQGIHLIQLLSDVGEQYFKAVTITKKERWIHQFVHNCGKVCIDGFINREALEYPFLVEKGIARPEDATAGQQLDRVISHFAAEVATFDALYGKNSKAAKPERKPAERPALEVLIAQLPENTMLAEQNHLKKALAQANVSEQAAALLKYVLENQGFRPNDMKAMRGYKKLFGQVGYKELKNVLPALLDELSLAFKTGGVETEWLLRGQHQFTRYFLTLNGETKRREIVQQNIFIDRQRRAEKAKSAPLLTNHLVRSDLQAVTETEATTTVNSRAEVFTTKVGEYLIKLLDAAGKPLKASVLARSIEDQLHAYGVSRSDARDTITNVLANGVLYRAGSEEGNVTIWHKPVERERSKSFTSTTIKAETIITFESVEEKNLGAKLIKKLVNVGYQNKGITIRQLSILLDVDPTTTAGIASKLVSLGILSRKESWQRSHSPHSKKTKVMYIQIIDQNMWNKIKAQEDMFLDSYL